MSCCHNCRQSILWFRVRFHNLLLALMLRKPVVAISYHEKFQPLMDSVGLGGIYPQDIEHIDVDDLIGKINQTQKKIRRLSGFKLPEKRKAAAVPLDEQYVRFLKILTRPSREIRATGGAQIRLN